MKIEDKEKFLRLFEIYSSLLTEYQRNIFTMYYYDDLSLMEISENENVSRNAVFSLLHRVEKILLDYDEKLHLSNKYDDIIKTLEQSKIDNKVIEKVEKIMED